MGDLFKAGPFYPTPWSVDDCEPEPEPESGLDGLQLVT